MVIEGLIIDEDVLHFLQKEAHGFKNSHRGGPLGNTLRQLVPKDWSDTVRKRKIVCFVLWPFLGCSSYTE